MIEIELMGYFLLAMLKKKKGAFLAYLEEETLVMLILKTLSEESEFEIIITEENNKTYVRAVSKNGNIEDSEQLLSKINESLS